jgi:hypothetical protein
MADLSCLFEKEPTTIAAIDAWYEAKDSQRSWLGLSQAGHKCPRFLWYRHNGYRGKAIEGRVLRLFQLGNVLEEQVIIDLKSIGINHHSSQKEVTFTQGDLKLTGHIDGIVEGLVESPGTPHLFEMKTSSDKRFNELKKLGDYEKWDEKYSFQIQAYMVGLKLKRCAAFVYNKNTSEIMMFRIRVRKEETIAKLQMVFDAISGDMPDRIQNRADNFECKWCDFHKECFK